MSFHITRPLVRHLLPLALIISPALVHAHDHSTHEHSHHSTHEHNAQQHINAVAQQVEALSNAMVAGDAKQLNALAAEQLSYGHSSGKVENKAQFVDQIASGRSDFVSIELKNQHISIAGDTALVRHELFADIKDGGVANSIHLGILLVWQLQDGQWKLLARQAFKLPAPAAQ